jgi:hypothetical protein
MEDERRKFEEAKGVWPITNIQCILLSIIVMFGMAVALAAIDFKVQGEPKNRIAFFWRKFFKIFFQKSHENTSYR